MGNKSIKINMMLNAIRGFMSIVFPLISFPYISKVLGVDNIGFYNFANSIVSYFLLLAGLGISTYAIREGARVREQSDAFQPFVNEIFSINMLSTAVSYGLFFALLMIVPKFANYKVILIILSLQIIFKTIGIEWIYSIFEDYSYITIRSIVFQVLSLVLLFAFVKKQSDVNMYAAITVVSSVGSNILNFIHARKYCKIRLCKSLNLKKHLRPILVLFAMAVTVTIYVSSDTTILGFLCDDHTVGIYSVSVKVYSIIKTILSSVLVVSIPRLSALLEEKKIDAFNYVAEDIYSTLLTLVFPCITGIIMLRSEIVLLISDSTYVEAVSSLTLLSVALLFCLGAWFWGQCILVPLKQEKIVFEITVVSALVNIILNFALIPIWKENAAAFTTVVAEGLSFAWCWYKGRTYTAIHNTIKTTGKIVCGCLGIMLVILFLRRIVHGAIFIVLAIILSASVYATIEIVMKNEAVKSIMDSMTRKFRRRN